MLCQQNRKQRQLNTNKYLTFHTLYTFINVNIRTHIVGEQNEYSNAARYTCTQNTFKLPATVFQCMTLQRSANIQTVVERWNIEQNHTISPFFLLLCTFSLSSIYLAPFNEYLHPTLQLEDKETHRVNSMFMESVHTNSLLMHI